MLKLFWVVMQWEPITPWSVAGQTWSFHFKLGHASCFVPLTLQASPRTGLWPWPATWVPVPIQKCPITHQPKTPLRPPIDRGVHVKCCFFRKLGIRKMRKDETSWRDQVPSNCTFWLNPKGYPNVTCYKAFVWHMLLAPGWGEYRHKHKYDGDFADVDRQRKQIDLQIVVDVAIWEQARPIQTASSCWLLSAQSNEIQTTCHLFFSKPTQKQDTWNLENFGQSVIIVIRMTCLFCSGPNLGTSEPHVKRCHVGLTTETRKFWSDGVLESVYFYAFLASKKVSSGHSKMCSVWGLWEAYHPPYLVLTCL